MIMINQVIGVFNDDGIEDLMSKSQHCDCTFIYRNDADTELVHKLQTIYKEESSRLRNDFKAIHGFLFQSSLQFVYFLSLEISLAEIEKAFIRLIWAD